MRKFASRFLLSTALGFSVMPHLHAQTMEEQAIVLDQATLFDIPAQALDKAIQSYSRQTDVQVLFNPALVAGKSAAAVRGRLRNGDALERLLKGSGLSYDIVGNGVVLRTAVAERDERGSNTSSGVQLASADMSGLAFEELVVTGRAGAGRRTKAETSYAITTLDEAFLQDHAPLSTADLLKSVPGFWVEASGGEASNNVRVRGIPRDGYSSVSLQEDGLPIQHDGGLGYLNADQSFRLDETIERVEVVRGGPAPIFASNAPGGIVNFITRRPTDEAEGILKLELGDYNHQRLDLYYGGPIDDNWYMTVGGFYRQSDGLRDPGFRGNEGGQIRVGIGRDFENGRFDFNIKHIDDKVAFYLPVPLTYDEDGKIVGVPGFDPSDGTLAGPDNANVQLRNINDPYFFDLTDGSHTQLTQISANLDFDVWNDWQVQNKFRYRTSDITRNGLFPTGSVQPAADQLDSLRADALAAFPGATDLQIRYATDPSLSFDLDSQNGNGLVVGGNLLAVSVPLDEVINDLRLQRQFDFGGQTHDISFGAYLADLSMRFDRYMSTSLLEVRDQARRLDVLAVDADGNVVGSVTENGFLRHGSLYDNNGMNSQSYAFYASDEWQITNALRIDFGGRYEHIHIDGSVEDETTVDLGDPDTLADDAVYTGTGRYQTVDRSFDDWAWTVGANYQIRDNMGVFARYTDSFRLPNASTFIGNANRDGVVVEGNQMAEAGLKWAESYFSLYLTAFYSVFDGLQFTTNVFNQATNEFEQQYGFADTETYGVEAEGIVRPLEWFDIGFGATLQKPEYSSFTFNEVVDGELVERSFDGNQLIRVPEVMLRVSPGLNLFNGRFRAQLDVRHFSRRYADVANTVRLPNYTVLDANVSYDVNEAMTIYGYASNLTNSIGLTEGNPRAGEFVGVTGEYFLGRPLLGRSFRVAVGYSF